MRHFISPPSIHHGKAQVCMHPLEYIICSRYLQQMMDQILKCCGGIIAIADNIVIHRKDDEGHDQNLHDFMYIAHEYGPVFNGKKYEVKKDSVTFFGTVYDANRAHPDPKKVYAIHKISPPDNKLKHC